jgi:dTDP-4-amino-4,6-dideoxygalactose transaminase
VSHRNSLMKVPLLDLKAQHATIRDQVLAAVTEVLDSQVCIGGAKVAELEQKIAAVSGCKYAVGVSSGTDALLCSLMALNIGPGDEVITTPFTFFATAGSIARTGATPVFVDIDPCTYNINSADIEKAVTKRTKAIVPVHLFGQMCDMDPIMDVANRHGLSVIEDAAQSITATYQGRPAGSVGRMGCFSFFPSKNLGGAGDGGMVVTNDPALYERLVLLRNHGAKPKYFHRFVGGNFRLDPIQAAVLLVKLPHLAEWSERRRANADRYNRLFAGTPIGLPWISPNCVSIYNQYVIRVSWREELMAYLKDREIGVEIYYPQPLHLQACFEHLGYEEGDLPESEAAAKSVLALPIYPELPGDSLSYIADSVLDTCRRFDESAAEEREVCESR